MSSEVSASALRDLGLVPLYADEYWLLVRSVHSIGRVLAGDCSALDLDIGSE